MTSEKNRTAPNSFARYIENTRARAFVVMNSIEIGPDAEKFPCTVCGGEGVILKTVKYSRLRNFTGYFQNREDQDIQGKEVIYCPCCQGTGVDEKALLKYVDEVKVA